MLGWAPTNQDSTNVFFVAHRATLLESDPAQATNLTPLIKFR